MQNRPSLCRGMTAENGWTAGSTKKECAEPMKNSCLIAVAATLAAVAGALTAVAVYLRRREKELDEYERLLFGEDKAETVEPAAEQPAEDTSAEDAAE